MKVGATILEATFSIDTPDALASWLDGKSRAWALPIAARTALRVFPLVLPDPNSDPQSDSERANLVLQTARADFLAWAACLAENDDQGQMLDAPASAAATAVDAIAGDSAAARAAARAADASSADEFVAGVRDTAEAAALAVRPFGDEAQAAFWGAIAADTSGLEQTSDLPPSDSPPALINQSLWPNKTRAEFQFSDNLPLWAGEKVGAFDKSAWVTKGPWGVWTAWYREILSGAADDARQLFPTNHAFVA